MSDDLIKESLIEKEMLKCIFYFEEKIKRIHISRINTKIISHLIIKCYDKTYVLNDLSRISIDNSSTIRISLFDKCIIRNVEKSILLSKLDVYMLRDKYDIILHIPILTEERRNNVLKNLKIEKELAKVAIRNKRKFFKNKIKDLLKDKDINDSYCKIINNKLQNITNSLVEKINIIFKIKEREILNK